MPFHGDRREKVEIHLTAAGVKACRQPLRKPRRRIAVIGRRQPGRSSTRRARMWRPRTSTALRRRPVVAGRRRRWRGPGLRDRALRSRHAPAAPAPTPQSRGPPERRQLRMIRLRQFGAAQRALDRGMGDHGEGNRTRARGDERARLALPWRGRARESPRPDGGPAPIRYPAGRIAPPPRHPRRHPVRQAGRRRGRARCRFWSRNAPPSRQSWRAAAQHRERAAANVPFRHKSRPA